MVMRSESTSNDLFARAVETQQATTPRSMDAGLWSGANMDCVYVITATARRGRQRSCTAGLTYAALPLSSVENLE